MDAVLGPEPAGGVSDTLVVEGAGDVQDSPACLGHAKDALHHGGGRRVGFQGWPLLGPVLHHELAVAVGHAAGDPEAARSSLSHTPDNFLRQIFAVEFIHRLDDGLHELAGGRVVGVLGDGYHPDALAPEHGPDATDTKTCGTPGRSIWMQRTETVAYPSWFGVASSLI